MSLRDSDALLSDQTHAARSSGLRGRGRDEGAEYGEDICVHMWCLWQCVLALEDDSVTGSESNAIDSIVRGAHLLPVYVVDPHAHQLISSYYNFL